MKPASILSFILPNVTSDYDLSHCIFHFLPYPASNLSSFKKKQQTIVGANKQRDTLSAISTLRGESGRDVAQQINTYEPASYFWMSWSGAARVAVSKAQGSSVTSEVMACDTL